IAVLGDPPTSFLVQSQTRCGHITFQTYWPRQVDFGSLFPQAHDSIDAFDSGLLAVTANDNSDRVSALQKVAQKITSHKASRTSQQEVLHEGISTSERSAFSPRHRACPWRACQISLPEHGGQQSDTCMMK